MVEESRKPKQQLVVTPHGLAINDPAPQAEGEDQSLNLISKYNIYISRFKARNSLNIV